MGSPQQRLPVPVARPVRLGPSGAVAPRAAGWIKQYVGVLVPPAAVFAEHIIQRQHQLRHKYFPSAHDDVQSDAGAGKHFFQRELSDQDWTGCNKPWRDSNAAPGANGSSSELPKLRDTGSNSVADEVARLDAGI